MTQPELDPDSADADFSDTPLDNPVDNAHVSDVTVSANDEPVTPTSVGLWGPSGMGKTAFAGSLLSDLGFTPALYIDIDGGLPALKGYEAADLLVHRPATTCDDVTRLIRDVQSGRITNRAGKPIKSVIVDAVSCLIANEIGARGLTSKDPKDQAQALGARFKVLWGQLRSLHRDMGIVVVQIAHAKVKSAKVLDSVQEMLVPDMFASIARPWMASVRHLWRITKTRGKKGPAYPLMMLRTEADGVAGTATYVEYMKTSNIAFAQWIAGECGKREQLEWDTGTLPVDQQPTLAQLLRTCEALVAEQGRYASTDAAALRALSSLQTAMDAADTTAK